jgi:hypothetical protein
LFHIGGRYFNRHHAHEKNYANDKERNESYHEACRALASRLGEEMGGSKCLVYAPLRGALPIWRTISSFLPGIAYDVYHPVLIASPLRTKLTMTAATANSAQAKIMREA